MKTNLQKFLNKMNSKYKKYPMLLKNIKKNMPKLKELLNEVNDHWGYEDTIYRYYHTSFKVYYVQALTLDIYKALRSISPHKNKYDLDENFMRIIFKGTGHKFELSHNQEWDLWTLPILQAFFHAKYFLEMAVKYGEELETAPQFMPSGWACLLHLYNIR